MSSKYDAVIIGSGHNGLVCGTYLAKAGLKVLVTERRDVIGGAAVTEEVVPGFRMSVASYVMSLLAPKIIKELELPRYGLKVLPANDMFMPLDRYDGIIFSDDVKKTQKELARFSKNDAERYAEFDKTLNEAADVVRKLLWVTPPDPTKRDWKHLKANFSFLWMNRKIGSEFYSLWDLFTQSAFDFLSKWFESNTVKALIGYYASIGTFASMKTPGSAYVLLHHVMGEHEGAGGWGFVRGGMGQISNAIAESGKQHGLEIQTGDPVEEVLVSGGRAAGVRTKDGKEYNAKVVASNANCKALFQQLVKREHLPTEFLREVDSYRTFSTAFKINIAAERPPQYAAFDKNKAGFDYPTYVHLGPNVEYLERAYLDAVNGNYSEKPFVTPVVPTIVDDTLAPPGKHVVNLFGGHAPYQLKGRDWDDERDHFTRNVLNVMDEFAPGFSSDVIDMQVLLPPDLEKMLALPQGHIFHGELALDQLFFARPVPGYADYRSPIAGLYQCGSSTHPGGGVSGIPGHNAAHEILKDWKRLSR